MAYGNGEWPLCLFLRFRVEANCRHSCKPASSRYRSSHHRFLIETIFSEVLLFAALFQPLRALRYLPLWISHSPPHALHPLSPVSCFLLLSNHVPRDRNHGRLSSDFPCIYVHVHVCMCCVCVYTACVSVRAYTCRLSDRKRELPV